MSDSLPSTSQPSPDSISISTSVSMLAATSAESTSTITFAHATYVDKGGTLKRNEFGRNEVWQFFRIYNEKRFKQHVFCLLCEKDVYYGLSHATSNLEKHISRHHKDDYKAIMCDRANKRQCVENTMVGSQESIIKFVKNCPSYEDCLLRWMIQTYQPLRAVEAVSFRNMISSLHKKAPIVSYAKIRSMLSSTYYDTMHSTQHILKCKDVVLTTDAWTSIAKDGYATCTLHFIEPRSWTIHRFSLGIFKKDGSSTAVDVVRYAEQHLSNFGITYQQLTCVVTDTEATMIAAGRLFKEKSVEAGGATAWHGCINHMLELVTKLAFKDIPNTQGTMSMCRSVVNFFNSSSQATSKLKEKAKARLGVPLTVIQDVCTRWWSTYSMCERLLRLKDVLTIMSLEGDLRVSLSEEQWLIVKNLVALLKPFMIAQRLLEGETYVTVSLIPYMIYRIRTGLLIALQDPLSSDQVKSVASLMIAKFNPQFGNGVEGTVARDHLMEGDRRRSCGIPRLVLIAVALDPRTKSFVGIPRADQDEIMQYVLHDLVELALSLGPPDARLGAAAAVEPLVMDENMNRVRRNAARYANDVNEFLDELDDVDVIVENVDDDDDDLLELEEANLFANNANIAGEGAWTREAVTFLVGTELDRYKLVPGIKMRDEATGKFNCPLKWWSMHQHDYYYVSKLALKYLPIPATSAPSERVFSAAGLTIAKDRARLDPDRANEVVFLHDNIPALENYNKIVIGAP